MPAKCCIPSCKIQKDDPGALRLSFFQVPKDVGRREKWASSINNFFKSEIEFKKFTYVCELHFEETSFNNDLMGQRLRLTKQAYPTIFHKMLSCDEQINFFNSNVSISNKTLPEESSEIAGGERSQNVASYNQQITRKNKTKTTVSNELIKNEMESNFTELLSNIKTEKKDNFEESKLKFENLHQFDFCKIKTENCVDNFPQTKSDIMLISRENIKIENVDLNEYNQEVNNDFEMKTETFDFPIFKNDDFDDKLQAEQTIKIGPRKKRFVTAKTWKSHFGKFYEKCLFCGQFFYHKLLFLNHYYINHLLVNNKKSVNSRKSNCNKKFVNIKNLQYKLCSKIFYRNLHVKKRLKSNKPKKNSLLKSLLMSDLFNSGSSTSTQKYNSQQHIKTVSEQKSFKCEICFKYYTTYHYLKKHYKTHTGEIPFKCEICSKSFTVESNLRAHIRIHTGEKPFICKVCSKCFTQSSSLKTHIRTHTGESPFKCEFCSKCFAMQSNLNKHIRIHTGERPFKCTFCEKSFTQSNALKRHIKTHTGEKPFKCEICSKCFPDVRDLKIHIRSHTGENPFKCEICSKGFSVQSNLKKHIRIHTR